MNQYHEMRHLYVHQLGKVDEKYKHSYGRTDTHLQIDDHLMQEVFLDFENFVKGINRQLSKKVLIEPRVFNRSHGNYICIIKTEAIDKLYENLAGRILLDDENCFFFSNDLITYIDYKEDHSFIELSGKRHQVDALIKEARRLPVDIVIVYPFPNDLEYSIADPNSGNEKTVHTSSKLVELVIERLPKRPWEKGIHKKIAEEMNMSNSQISKAIGYIVKMNIELGTKESKHSG